MKYLAIIVVSILVLSGCKGDPGPAGPVMSGDISGRVSLRSDKGLMLKDNSGVTISLLGKSFTTQTLPDGSWKITGVPAGIYDVAYSKPGFATIKEYGLQFVGGGTMQMWNRYTLYQLPLASITDFKLTQTNIDRSIRVSVKIANADSLSRSIMMLFSKEPLTVSSTMKYLYSESMYVPADSSSYSTTFTFYDELKTYYELSSGSTLYAIAYVAPRGGYYSGYNPYTDSNEIYNSGYVFSNIQTIVVP